MNDQKNTKPGAFTLIELLVVIAIIALLASLVVWGTSRATDARVRSRVKTQLYELVTALETYKEKKGFYPPDNPGNPGTNQLFYELTGTVYDLSNPNSPRFTSIATGEVLDAGILSAALSGPPAITGFVNSAPDRTEVQNFFPTMNPTKYRMLPSGITVLVVPYRGPSGDLNTWRYSLSNPAHNPGGFDLWAEVTIIGKTVIIGNWE